MPHMVDHWNGLRYVPVPLDASWIEDQAKGNQKIALIKAYRAVSGNGLKDAKDAVEGCMAGDEFVGKCLDAQKLVNLFAPFIMTPEQIEEARQAAIRLNDEREAEYNRKQNEIESEHSKRITDALECVCKNWKVLGFKSKFQGCFAVLRNLEKNP